MRNAQSAAEADMYCGWCSLGGGRLQGPAKIARATRPLSHAFGACFLLGREGAQGRSIPGREAVGTEAGKDILHLGVG